VTSRAKPPSDQKATPARKSARKRAAVDVPLPGRAVRGSQAGRPIMAALDLLGRRWNLRVLWELRDAPLGFRELRGRCGDMSPDTLSTRLGELEACGLVDRNDARAWRLTPLGKRLGPAMRSLDRWANEWAESVGR
jgi:DNA-binding HxlR family transcriptional regulator